MEQEADALFEDGKAPTQRPGDLPPEQEAQGHQGEAAAGQGQAVPAHSGREVAQAVLSALHEEVDAGLVPGQG